jgi:hypothetical protein
MVPEFENAGLQFVGKDDTGKRMEVCLELGFVGAIFNFMKFLLCKLNCFLDY